MNSAKETGYKLAISLLKDQIREAHRAGYMAGVDDSEDYDHDEEEREEIWWDFYNRTH
jgi:hypothetical protein